MTTIKKEIAVFAAGCFWGVEESFRLKPGVIKTTVGYTGGHTTSPTYEQVCSGATGHTEAVHIEYDPQEISYKALLDIFWSTHNPTEYHRQGLDIGSQYRSEIFYSTEKQKVEAYDSKKALEERQVHKKPVVTEITKLDVFYPAEEYHQKYLLKKGAATCRVL